MPYSDDRTNEKFLEIIKSIQQIKTFLDLGCGAGKCGKIVKSVYPQSSGIGLDAVPAYQHTYQLNSVYNEFVSSDLCDYIFSNLDRWWDLVVFGDVLEHLKKSKGIDVLNALSYMTSNIIVVYPDGYKQGALEGHEEERHLSRWMPNDFFICSDVNFYEVDYMRIVHIKPNFMNL